VTEGQKFGYAGTQLLESHVPFISLIQGAVGRGASLTHPQSIPGAVGRYENPAEGDGREEGREGLLGSAAEGLEAGHGGLVEGRLGQGRWRPDRLVEGEVGGGEVSCPALTSSQRRSFTQGPSINTFARKALRDQRPGAAGPVDAGRVHVPATRARCRALGARSDAVHAGRTRLETIGSSASNVEVA
jgi:hypothetical protein